MKALALFSGGLDNMLAMKLITAQSIEVRALNINIGVRDTSGKSEVMKKHAAMVDANFEVIDVRNSYLQEVLFNPQYGYGKHFNPCIDCHAFMSETALAMLGEGNTGFIITGEVLGQRPISQRSDTVTKVKKLALGKEDLILRPMCAKNLPLTKPEREGWIDREELEGTSGRSHKRQFELAAKFGLGDFESPDGGCLLTLDSFVKRIRDSIESDKDMQVNDTQLLKYGRHSRLLNGAEMIIDRNELENILLKGLKTPKYEVVELEDLIGAYSLLSTNADEKNLELALKVALTYTKHEANKSYELRFKDKSHKSIAFENEKEINPFFIS